MAMGDPYEVYKGGASVQGSNLVDSHLRRVNETTGITPSMTGAKGPSLGSYSMSSAAKEILWRRLRFQLDPPNPIGDLMSINIDFLEVHVPPAADVMVFAVKGDEAVILRDDRRMFPSDTLIAQLRMMMD